MERQLLMAQLPILLKQRAAQYRFGRQPLPADGLEADPDQISGHLGEQIVMLVKPLRHRLQLVADLVRGENIECAGLDGAFLAHCRLRRWQGFGLSGMSQDT